MRTLLNPQRNGAGCCIIKMLALGMLCNAFVLTAESWAQDKSADKDKNVDEAWYAYGSNCGILFHTYFKGKSKSTGGLYQKEDAVKMGIDSLATKGYKVESLLTNTMTATIAITQLQLSSFQKGIVDMWEAKTEYVKTLQPNLTMQPPGYLEYLQKNKKDYDEEYYKSLGLPPPKFYTPNPKEPYNRSVIYNPA